MAKRAFSALLLIYMGLYSIFSPMMLYAVSTNGVASPWTIEKAEQLARKALLGATPTIINQLYQAGSAAAAVDILFPDTVGPSRAAYNAEVTTLTTSTGFSFTDNGSMRKLYQLRYYRDPYEAKVKLFSLFEDIFPVNQGNTITYQDIKDQQDLLYANTLGNYKTLVKRILYNNGQPGDYAEGKFLDLLDGSNKNYPNENYARELLQLFLMGEYKNGESKELGSVRNYEETDVAALAKILTGLRSDTNTHVVSYDATQHNTSTGVLFLSGTLSSNPFSSFYDNGSGTLDLGAIQTSISGNNGLTDNTIDYIFAQRAEAISLFLADRLFRFYIHGKPTRSELDTIAANIRANNFEMLPSVKTLLASDLLYSDASMNGVSYKNPLEITIGTLKILHDKDPLTVDPRIFDTSLLDFLGWTPYYPGSVFGREWFDDTDKWFTAYTENQWISFATRLASTTTTGSYLFSNIVPTTSITLSGSSNPVTTSMLNTYSGTTSIVGTGTITLGSGTSFDYNGGTVSLPNFTVGLGSGILSIDQGNIDLSNLQLIVSSGSLVYSGTTYTSFTGSFPLNPSTVLSRQSSVDEVITQIEDSVLSSRRLPESVKTKMWTYATTSSTGATIAFTPTNSTTQSTKIRGMIALALASPEFVLQTGHDIATATGNTAQTPIDSTNNKLVLIELNGGYDWLHGIIQKDQYATYQSLRTNSSGTIAIAPQNLTDLGDFYMNNAIAYSGANGPSLKSLYDSNNLRIFNRVGTSLHSRDHDAAQKQSTSYSDTTDYRDDGIFGHIIKEETDGSNTISLSWRRPNIFRNGNYINIGPSGATFVNYAPITTAEKTSQLNLFRDVFATREYAGTTNGVFKNAAKIDEVATASVARGGPNGSGWGNKNNFLFLQSLLSSGVGKTFFMQGDGGYDTHSNQLAPSSNFDPNNIPHDLNYNIGGVMANITNFFNSVKATENITIVVYSDFGRTLRLNGDLGTDHGEAGGMFVITNNPALQSNLPNKIYGNMDLLKEKANWLGVGIDYRSVYGKIYNALYGISHESAFPGIRNTLEEDVDTTVPPKFVLTRNEFLPGYNSSSARLTVPFRMEDPNFSIDYGSNFIIDYGPSFSNLRSYPQYYVDNLLKKSNGSYIFNVGIIGRNSPYVYRIRAIDNQYRETILTGSLNIPDIRVGTSTGTAISTTTDTIVYAHNNRVFSGTLSLTGTTAITLADNGTGTTSTITARDGITINLGTGTTQVDSIASASGSIAWNGGFILGEAIDKNFFVSSGAITSGGASLSTMNIEKIIKVGADTLGVQMNLNQNVILNVSWMTGGFPYTILRSEDGMVWTSIGTSSAVAGVLSFPTNAFSYFALVSGAPVACIAGTVSGVQSAPISASTAGLCPGGQTVGNFSSSISGNRTNYAWSCNGNVGGNCSASYTAAYVPSGGGGGGGGSSLSIDSCSGKDYSPSYYDKTCGTAPTTTGTGNTNTSVTAPTVSISGGFLNNNSVINAYQFQSNKRFPQNVTNELRWIITNIVSVIDNKSAGNLSKKTAYYKAVDAYLLKKWNQSTIDKEKRILENLHSRLVFESNGILSYKPSVTVIQPNVQTTVVTMPVTSVSAADFASLGIDFSNPAFTGYDYTQNKRFPRTITTVLDRFTLSIVKKIDSENNRDVLFVQVLNLLDNKIRSTTDVKERKIAQYVRNHVYLEQQERKIAQ